MNIFQNAKRYFFAWLRPETDTLLDEIPRDAPQPASPRPVPGTSNVLAYMELSDRLDASDDNDFLGLQCDLYDLWDTLSPEEVMEVYEFEKWRACR